MSFPYSDCPPADDLLAFHAGTITDSEERARIERHVASCVSCRRALERGSAVEQPASGMEQVREQATVGYTALLEAQTAEERGRLAARLAEQQRRVARMLAEPRPEPMIGQVWTLLVRAGSGSGRSFGVDRLWDTSFLVAVLGVHQSELGKGSRFVNVAPVTEDTRLASEWSLVLEPQESGIGTAAVIHVDHERSASVSCLRRCIGRLPQAAGEDLLTLLRGWSRGETPSAELKVSRLGQSAIRTRSDWKAFDVWLADSMRAGCGGPSDGADEGDEEYGTPAVLADDALSNATASEPVGARPLATVGPTVGGSGPAGAADPGQDSTFGSAVHAYLQSRYGGDLQAWCDEKRASISWADVATLADVPVAALLDPSGIPSREIGARISRLPSGKQSASRRLVVEVKYFVDEQTGVLQGQTIRDRAARVQYPRSGGGKP